MNTIGCSPIGRNRLSSWILGRSKVGSETYIVGGTKDHQESAWIEPGGVLRRVQPHLHEYAGARPQKSELCEVMEIHPLTLLTLAYAGDDLQQVDQLLAQVRQQLETVTKKSDTP